MIVTRRHMSTTLLIAMLLHGGIAIWFSLPEPAPQPVPVQPLRINLLAAIAETTTNASSVIPESPVKPEPVRRPAPVKPPATPVKPVHEPQQMEPEVARNAPEAEFDPEATAAEATEIAPAQPADSAILDTLATARYEQLLVAWLEKHKKYPRRAKRLRIEGEGMLRILIDRTGQTRQVSLAQPTGNRLLDKAALAMAKRANPFPPMPENDPRRELEFIVPVAFVLR